MRYLLQPKSLNLTKGTETMEIIIAIVVLGVIGAAFAFSPKLRQAFRINSNTLLTTLTLPDNSLGKESSVPATWSKLILLMC